MHSSIFDVEHLDGDDDLDLWPIYIKDDWPRPRLTLIRGGMYDDTQEAPHGHV